MKTYDQKCYTKLPYFILNIKEDVKFDIYIF